MMFRRGFLSGLVSLMAAPAIVRAESLMPVRSFPIGEVYLDYEGYPWGWPTPEYMLRVLRDGAAQQGLQIRRPRFSDYATEIKIPDRVREVILRDNDPRFLHYDPRHHYTDKVWNRRCTVEVHNGLRG